MIIPKWPLEDRPREKLLTRGEQALTDAELIAIFLKTGVPNKTALDLAKELLAEYGNLKKLIQAPLSALLKKPGIGKTKYVTLKAAIELGKRYLNENLLVREKLSNAVTTKKFLNNRLRHHVNEVFACIFLDTHFRVIHFEELFHGTVNEANIYLREIIRRSLYHNAAKLILAHNHPSGHPMPSQADKEITKLIQQTVNLIDIEVIDHIIVGNPDNFSFAEMGLM